MVHHEEARCRTSTPALLLHNSIAGRAEHTVAITPEDVISWGANGDGQTGQGERAEAQWVKPRSLKPLQGMMVTQVVCGRAHTLCVTATSQVPSLPCLSILLHSRRRRVRNKLIQNIPITKYYYSSPIPAWQMVLDEPRSVTCAQVYAWGCNSLGQLGLSDLVNRRAPTVVDALWAMPVAQLAAGKKLMTINNYFLNLITCSTWVVVSPIWFS